MDSSDTLSADVFIAAAGGPEFEQKAADAFRAAGVEPTTSMAPPRRGLDGLQWAVLAVLPLNAFFGSLGSKLGADAYEGLKRLVRRILRESDEAPTAESLVLLDSESGVGVVLRSDLPLESFRQLFDVDLASVNGGVLHYALSHGQWRTDRGDAAATGRKSGPAPQSTAAVLRTSEP